MLNFGINFETYFIYLFLLFGIKSFSQSNENINKLVDKLSWESIEFNIHDRNIRLEYLDISAKKLIKIKKSKSNVLLKSIKNPEKTLAIHYILTKIYEPHLGAHGASIIYIYKDCDKLIGRHYFFNGLIWSWYEDTQYTISTKEIEKISNYWTNRLSKKITSWENDFSEISKSIQKEDSLKYPCNKIYDNNSDKLDISELVELLNSIYPSEKFKKTFSILGNDEKTKKFEDCYFISYYPDGISFRFDNDNILTTIFLDSNYKNELVHGLKLTDSKFEIISKLGEPNKIIDNNFWYDMYGLVISFYDNDKIMNIQINKK